MHAAYRYVGSEILMQISFACKLHRDANVKALAVARLLLFAADVAAEGQDNDIVPTPEERDRT